LAKDSRPIYLYGLSAGGMLTFHVAALNKKVSGIIGMTFLDQRNQQVRDETSYNKLVSRTAFLSTVGRKIGLGCVPLPMTMASKMYTLCNDPKALKACLSDKSSAGNWATVAFLNSYLYYEPKIEPEDFDICPILLTQPAEDKWTPLHLSNPVLSKISKVSTKVVMLENAGHYPFEMPGLQQMQDAVYEFIHQKQ
jgi:pimeloyl-ACP methyl ester carboxylesterase